jgi:hypothetical protein
MVGAHRVRVIYGGKIGGPYFDIRQWQWVAVDPTRNTALLAGMVIFADPMGSEWITGWFQRFDRRASSC